MAFLAGIALPSPARGQTGTVEGRVTSVGGGPIAGAQVAVEGTNLMGQTSPDGRFSLAVPAGTRTLRVSAIGYRFGTVQVTVVADRAATVNVELNPSIFQLDEVVVTAAGQERVRSVGNALTRVDVSVVQEKAASVTVSDLLQGRVAGVQLQKNSGSVGTATLIKTRGAQSLSLSNRPIVYVDGARINTETPGNQVAGQSYDRLNSIDPDDIESMEIIKGPAAATLYGTEASGGVVRILTKRGRSGQTRYTVRGEYGATWNAFQWPTSVWHPRRLFPTALDTLYAINLIETEKPFRTGLQRALGGNVTGGDRTVVYYVSADWQDRQGVTPVNGLEQLNARANFTITPSDRLSIEVSNGFTQDYTRLPEADNSVEGWVAHSQLSNPHLTFITRTDPNDPGSGPIETCAINFERSRTTGVPLAQLGRNGCGTGPGFAGYTYEDLATLEASKKTVRYMGSTTINYRVFDMWRNRMTIGYDVYADRFYELFPVNPAGTFGNRSLGEVNRDEIVGRDLTVEFSSGLEYAIGTNLSLKPTVGLQYFGLSQRGARVYGNEFPAGAAAVSNAVTKQAFDNYVESKTLGFFAQQEVGWKNRLFITPGIRFDDNSAFGANLEVQSYPRVSVSWVASEEPWMPGLFEQLKVRGAVGVSGLQPGTTNALALYSPVPVSSRDRNLLGVTANQPGNPELKPERGEEIEVGFDLGARGGSLHLGFTYYFQTTRDVIVRRPLAPSEGFPSAKWENLGEVKNSGLELDLGYRPLETPRLAWDWQVSFSTNHNEITKLPVAFSASNTAGGQIFKEGYPFAAYLVPEIRVESNGQVVVADTVSYRGKPLPTYEGSVGTTLSLFQNQLTLDARANYAFDRQLHDFQEHFRCQWGGGGEHGGICPQIEEKNPDGSYTDQARIKQEATRTGGSSFRAAWPFIYDADFIRLHSVSATVRLPGFITGVLGAASGTLRLAGHNLWLWTKYPGTDPEANELGQEWRVGSREFFSLPINPSASATLTLVF